MTGRFAAAMIGLCLSASGADAQTRDSAGIRIVESGAQARTGPNRIQLEPMPFLVLGSANSALQQQFGRVAAATRLSDGSVVVADGQALNLRRFDSAGHFIRSFGQKGDGPGDLRSISWLRSFGNDSVLVWDIRLQRLTSFTALGRLLATVVVERPPSVTDSRDGATISIFVDIIGQYADGSYLTSHRKPLGMSQETGMHADTLLIGRLAGRGPARDVARVLYREAFIYNFPNVSISDWAPFYRSGSLAAGARQFYASDGHAFEVREFMPSGVLVAIFRIRRAPGAVTSRDIAAFKTERLRQEPERYRKENERLNDWLTFPASRPAFDALRSDARGRLWAQVAGDSTQSRQWEVFAPTGIWLGTVSTPAGLEVLEIGHDYLLGRARDPDGVDVVQVIRMHGG